MNFGANFTCAHTDKLLLDLQTASFVKKLIRHFSKFLTKNIFLYKPVSPLQSEINTIFSATK
jgi:hypothetical protein